MAFQSKLQDVATCSLWNVVCLLISLVASRLKLLDSACLWNMSHMFGDLSSSQARRTIGGP